MNIPTSTKPEVLFLGGLTIENNRTGVCVQDIVDGC